MVWELDIVDGRLVRVRELTAPSTTPALAGRRELPNGMVKDEATGVVDWPTTRNLGRDPLVPLLYTPVRSNYS